jgi:hypothetical protein
MKEWVKGCDMGFYVGQEVTTTDNNYFIDQIKNDIFRFTTKTGLFFHFLKDGRLNENDNFPSVFPIELTPKFYQPEWQPKQGDWCWFWDGEYKVGCIGRFVVRNSRMNYIASGVANEWENCAPFDGNMTPPWERGEEK